MVLAARLVGIQTLIFLTCISSCRANENLISDQASFKQYTLQLASDADRCKLLTSEGPVQKSFELSIRPPCYFSRRASAAPQYFPYPKQGISAVILVIGNPITESARQKWNLEKDQICGDQRQAILITTTEITVSNNILEGGVTCKDKGSDEKDFAYFALSAKKAGNKK